MDPTKLPVTVLLALGLTGCGLKDRLGPCLSIQQLDSGADDSGADDSGSDDSGADDSGSDDSGSDESSADAKVSTDRARLLERARVDGALPSDVVQQLSEDP